MNLDQFPSPNLEWGLQSLPRTESVGAECAAPICGRVPFPPLVLDMAGKCCAGPGCLCAALSGFRHWILLSGQDRKHSLNESGMQVEWKGEAVSMVSSVFRRDRDLVS